MSLISNYTTEFIPNEENIMCYVLNTENINFEEAVLGRKSKETLIIRASGDELIETINGAGLIESTYITKPGEAIFYNSEKDIYVPRDSEGNAWQFEQIESYGYEVCIGAFTFEGNEAVKVKSTKVARLLPEAITMPTCIKDAWGEGNHQFLYAGATLKQDLDTDRVTGIDKLAFDSTWEITGNSKVRKI